MLEKLHMYIESVHPVTSKGKIHHVLDRVVRVTYDKFIEGQCNHQEYGSGLISQDIIGQKLKPLHKLPEKCPKCDGHGLVADG